MRFKGATAPGITASADPQIALLSKENTTGLTRRTGIPGLENPRPEYPWISRKRGEQGRVLIDVVVDAMGRATSMRIKLSSGFARLDEAALKSVRAWKFVPARRFGMATKGRIEVPITFRLTD